VTDLKDKNKVVTQKFQTCKKEKDDLKNENKDL
jgi:FtsZ-binding cell division protein ZapB